MFPLNPATQSHGGNNTLLSHVGALHVLVCASPSVSMYPRACVCICVCGCTCTGTHATYMMLPACQLGEQIWIEWHWTQAQMKLLCLEAVSQRVGKLVLWALCTKNS